jgi:hypothetical protein
VNTDADNQYSAKDIEKLIKPILDKEADISYWKPSLLVKLNIFSIEKASPKTWFLGYEKNKFNLC